jgi:hypothetical protein
MDNTINLATTRMQISTRFETEKCKICGKLIYFTYDKSKADYVYRQQIKGRYKYYCGWSCFRKNGRGKGKVCQTKEI